MKDASDNGDGRKGGAGYRKARNALHGCFLMSAVTLAGCGASVTGPSGQSELTRANPTPSPLRVRLSVEQLDDKVCQVRLTAAAMGGQTGSYAEWGDMEVRSYDANTGELISMPRTQQIYPDVFDDRLIGSGETQWGELDFERFRRDEGMEVLVELDLTYKVVGADGQDQEFVAQYTHSCQ